MRPRSGDGERRLSTLAEHHVRFLPKDEGFFTLFDQLSGHLNAAAEQLQALFADPSRREELTARIKTEEHAADALTYEVLQRIDRSFVTPLDREDIHLLTNRLDNVVDLIDGTARRVTMYQITEPRAAASELTRVLRAAASTITDGVKHIRKPAEVHRVARRVKELEEEADQIYSEAIAELFTGRPDPLEVIKWKEILDNLEHAVDECEDVANVLESISLKNS
jgi:predicted phosphate transport protein (TIGR00153 family)